MSDQTNDLQQYVRFQTLLSNLKDSGSNCSEQGTLFELFCKKVLEVAPFFTDDVAKVWLWKDFPGNGGLHDNGIDLVALDKLGRYWAIQCKFYDKDAHVSRADVDSFISAASREFTIDGVTYRFKERYVFSTTENISQNNANLFVTIGPDTLFECGIDWKTFHLDDIDSMKASPKKTVKDHQRKAIADVMKGFKDHDRGRMIMACGTGKTFTSLKIVEQLYSFAKQEHAGDHDFAFNVLYLVPSIALLSQTIKEWKTQNSLPAEDNIRAFGVCSDATAGEDKGRRRRDRDEMMVLMPIPASTDVNKIAGEYKRRSYGINIFYSTYQSIEVVKAVADQCGIVFDIAVCDEAHRTIGAFKDDDDDSDTNFVKIHSDDFIKCRKRLYMTATEKVYSSNAKQEAEQGGWSVYSMDDETIYGPQFHCLSFGQAVSQQLLTDYRLVVLNIRKSDVLKLHLPESAFSNLDDSAKILGSLSALSKIPSELSPHEFDQDPNPMKRAVVFCASIAQAKATAESFNHLSDKKCLGEEYMKAQGFVLPKAKLITGQDNSSEKDKLLNWLRNDIKDGECRILTNARCLSEGVDVPSLDAVVFMAKKSSQVDIIQAVGRVMRKFGSGQGKKYGYIVIPVVINDEELTDRTLSNSDEFKVVWRVVQALRSHDERLNTEINKVGVTGQLPSSVCFIDTFIPPRANNGCVVGSLSREAQEGLDSDNPAVSNLVRQSFTIRIPSDDEFKREVSLFGAQLVKHCGNRLYWEDWSKNIGEITNNVALRIKSQIEAKPESKKAFDKFVREFRKLLNPSVSEDEGINMLAEHVVTLPVLKAIFAGNDLIDQNPVTQIMERMVNRLSGLNKEIERLAPFYDSVKRTVEGVTSSEGRQEIIRKLFEKFFQYALPNSAEKFGIVYTPVEVVDFIINSVVKVLQSEFGESITKPGIKILDPFTGTGTFIVRLLDKLKELDISKEEFKDKYQNDIWCNEIMLLAYYIALVNIEDTFGRIGNQGFVPFDHAVLTDTFQLAEKRRSKFYQTALFEEEEFAKANSKAKEEDDADIRIIIGNPPYSVGQKNANDNNGKDTYVSLDQRIRDTYLKGVNKNAAPVFDSYVRAFRWASDRIGEDGIISFVSNGSYIDNLAFSGFRRELLKEFNHAYIYNLRGNQRTQGELSRKEGGKIFGSGSRNTICIVVLVKHHGQPLDGFIHYHDIGDYLSREKKLSTIADAKDIDGITWERVYPDQNNDWLNKTDESYKNFLLLGNKKDAGDAVFAGRYSTGIKTGKDGWQYNFSLSTLYEKNELYLKTYNSEVKRYLEYRRSNPNKPVEFNDFVDRDPKKIKWSNALYIKGSRGLIIEDNHDYRIALYRPFIKKRVAFNPPLFYDFVKWGNLKPEDSFPNLFISIPGLGNNKDFMPLISDSITDLCYTSNHCQCFPLYWYEKGDTQTSLLHSTKVFLDGYSKDYAIKPDIVNKFRSAYSDESIGPEDIFHYIYGLFHSKEYINKYKNNLAKEMPRVPFAEDFWGYANIGQKLMELHLNYEAAPAYEDVIVSKKKEDYSVNKIRFASKEDKTTLIYNDFITISNIPLCAYDYVVNGRSPVEWVIDQYQYSVDPDSGIIDDPNLFDEEKGGKYVFDLILSLVTVSLKTLDLVSQLPEYKEKNV